MKMLPAKYNHETSNQKKLNEKILTCNVNLVVIVVVIAIDKWMKNCQIKNQESKMMIWILILIVLLENYDR